MYQKFIELSEDSYIEITSRLYNQEEIVVLALRGTKDQGQPAIASVMLKPEEVELTIQGLMEALHRDPNEG